MPLVPVDPVNSGGKYYYYYNYPTGPTGSGCPSASGNFYVLGVSDMEASQRPYSKSPGWSCDPSVRNWQNEFDWVVGGFTN